MARSLGASRPTSAFATSPSSLPCDARIRSAVESASEIAVALELRKSSSRINPPGAVSNPPPEELWDRYRRSVVHRAERGIAWTLIAAGVAILGAWALWHWLEAWLARDLPIVVKVASAALMVGAALLLLSIVRER